MRILILSDSHLRTWLLPQALAAEPEAELIIHLGDGAEAMPPYLEADRRPAFLLRGNCDKLLPCMTEILETDVAGSHIYAAHGHQHFVKYEIDKLALEARLHGADIVLYGHTHMPFYEYLNGMHIFNPGALQNGHYGVIDIVPQGILCVHKEV